MGHKLPGDGEGLSYLLLQQKMNHKLPSVYEGSDNAGVEHAEVQWCSMECEYAQWPKDNVDGAKSCRTFNALWCDKMQEHVTRNTPCAALHGQRRPKPNW